ncbi:MAG: NADH-quinone oxidoreductase subunit C, partial [Betaproteobacteria bacterium]|nr:NADH-quinone oxidoreductase subunit C [Betaproteobacteria bacterium]
AQKAARARKEEAIRKAQMLAALKAELEAKAKAASQTETKA